MKKSYSFKIENVGAALAIFATLGALFGAFMGAAWWAFEWVTK